jgi:hypothetical protein
VNPKIGWPLIALYDEKGTNPIELIRSEGATLQVRSGTEIPEIYLSSQGKGTVTLGGRGLEIAEGEHHSELTAQNLSISDSITVGTLKFKAHTLQTATSLSISLDNPERNIHLSPDSLWLWSGSPHKSSMFLTIHADRPEMSFTDAEGYQATLGGSDLKNEATGTVTKRSAASLVMFDSKGKVIWSAP